MGQADGALRVVIARGWVLAAILLSGAAARADDVVFRDIVWPRHDRQTGFLEWELRADTARPKPKNQYALFRLELNTYNLVTEKGKRRSKKEMHLTAERGTYQHGLDSSAARLAGDVRGKLYGSDPLDFTTDDATVTSTWNPKEDVKTRTITTESDVSVVGPTRKLTGKGMKVEEETSEKAGKTTKRKSLLTLHKNVLMEIWGDAEGGLFPEISGPREKPAPGAEPERTRITCDGPLDYNRTEGRADFHNSVVLTQGTTNMKCRTLMLDFEETTPQETAEMKLKHMRAEKDVVLTTGDQTFVGDRFQWDQHTQIGALVGRPVRMTAPDAAATSKRIEFHQKEQLIKYIGDAEVHIILKAE